MSMWEFKMGSKVENPDLPEAEVEAMFNKIDVNGNGFLGRKEFMNSYNLDWDEAPKADEGPREVGCCAVSADNMTCANYEYAGGECIKLF